MELLLVEVICVLMWQVCSSGFDSRKMSHHISYLATSATHPASIKSIVFSIFNLEKDLKKGELEYWNLLPNFQLRK